MQNRNKVRRTLQLNKDFYDLMNLPLNMREASIDKVPVSVKPRIDKWLSKMDKALLDGVGACIYGSPGCGKSSIAAVVAKTARSREFSVRWTSAWGLREGLRSTFGGAKDTIYDSSKEVDLLIVDQLRAGDFDEQKTFSLRDFISLLESRKEAKLSTIVTLSDHPFQYGVQLPLILAAGRPGMVSVEVAGPDLRTLETEKLEAEYLGASTGF